MVVSDMLRLLDCSRSLARSMPNSAPGPC